jgi:predicted CoA-binding protein
MERAVGDESMDERARIDAFLRGTPFAVVGASRDRSKYGNRVLRAYRSRGFRAYAVNPGGGDIEGEPSYPDLAALPERPHGVSVVTPPGVTDRVLRDAAALGLRHVWLQPGAESGESERLAEELGLSLLSGGPCVLVELAGR